MVKLKNENAKKFLKVLEQRGGQADTSTIRKRVGLSRSQVHYYYDKLEGMNLIEIDRADEGYGDRDPPKVAILTDKARSEIKKGLLGNEVFEEEGENEEINEDYIETIERLKDRVNELENKESILSSHGVTNEEELSNRINEIFEKLEESNLDEDDYNNIKRRMNELEDYMEEWMMTAQAHIEAFETVFREEFNIRLEEYLKREETNLKGGGISNSQEEKERNTKEDTDFKLVDNNDQN